MHLFLVGLFIGLLIGLAGMVATWLFKNKAAAAAQTELNRLRNAADSVVKNASQRIGNS